MLALGVIESEDGAGALPRGTAAGQIASWRAGDLGTNLQHTRRNLLFRIRILQKAHKAALAALLATLIVQSASSTFAAGPRDRASTSPSASRPALADLDGDSILDE